MGVIISPETPELRDYIDTFIQRLPRYGVKGPKGWYSQNRPLTDKAVKAHLEKKRIIGTLAKWYPEFAVIDIDDRPIEFVDELRAEVGLDKGNSMLMSSESADSYHLLFRPSVDGVPPTRYKLNQAFKWFVKQKGIEFYPQAKHVIRLPFGRFQKCLDHEKPLLNTWESKLYWFHELDEFDLSGVPAQQLEFDFTLITDKRLPLLTGGSKGWFQAGAELFECGLQSPNSRHESQAKVIYYLWRQNIPIAETIKQVFAWIKKRHNGFSKDIIRYPGSVRKEIERQVTWIYSNFTWSNIYPDSTHNKFNGYITEPDVRDIIGICKGSVPRMRFLYELVKYSYPRRHRRFVNVHRDKLVKWGHETTYQRYLYELESRGIAKRGKAYSAGRFSKSLKLNWDYRNPDQAVLYGGRSIDSFENTVKLLYKPHEIRELLNNAGLSRQQSYEFIRRFYG